MCKAAHTHTFEIQGIDSFEIPSVDSQWPLVPIRFCLGLTFYSMNSTNKKASGAKNGTGASAKVARLPIAPPVYRPQAVPKTAQLKTIGGSNRKPPTAQAPRVVQMARLSGGSNIGYQISGHELFFNQHITAAIGASSRHATTQVSRDRTYIGSIRTFADRGGNNTVTDANVTRTLTATELSWAYDALETYVAANL